MADRITATCFAGNWNANMDTGPNSIARLCYIYIGTNANGNFIYRWPSIRRATETIAMARNARHDWIWYAFRKRRLHRLHRLHRSWGFFSVSIKHVSLYIFNTFSRWRLEGEKATVAAMTGCCCCYFTFADAITNHPTFDYIIFSISLFDFDSDFFLRNIVVHRTIFSPFFSHILTLSLCFFFSPSRC